MNKLDVDRTLLALGFRVAALEQQMVIATATLAEFRRILREMKQSQESIRLNYEEITGLLDRIAASLEE